MLKFTGPVTPTPAAARAPPHRRRPARHLTAQLYTTPHTSKRFDNFTAPLARGPTAIFLPPGPPSTGIKGSHANLSIEQ